MQLDEDFARFIRTNWDRGVHISLPDILRAIETRPDNAHQPIEERIEDMCRRRQGLLQSTTKSDATVEGRLTGRPKVDTVVE